jgi:hypothetical protein
MSDLEPVSGAGGVEFGAQIVNQIARSRWWTFREARRNRWDLMRHRHSPIGGQSHLLLAARIRSEGFHDRCHKNEALVNGL